MIRSGWSGCDGKHFRYFSSFPIKLFTWRDWRTHPSAREKEDVELAQIEERATRSHHTKQMVDQQGINIDAQPKAKMLLDRRHWRTEKVARSPSYQQSRPISDVASISQLCRRVMFVLSQRGWWCIVDSLKRAVKGENGMIESAHRSRQLEGDKRESVFIDFLYFRIHFA